MSREGVLYPRSYLRYLLRYRFMYVDRLERLEELVKHERAQAKAEIGKHLDGELTVRPCPRRVASAAPSPRAGPN
jgi:hypothetical protein